MRLGLLLFFLIIVKTNLMAQFKIDIFKNRFIYKNCINYTKLFDKRYKIFSTNCYLQIEDSINNNFVYSVIVENYDCNICIKDSSNDFINRSIKTRKLPKPKVLFILDDSVINSSTIKTNEKRIKIHITPFFNADSLGISWQDINYRFDTIQMKLYDAFGKQELKYFTKLKNVFIYDLELAHKKIEIKINHIYRLNRSSKIEKIRVNIKRKIIFLN